MSSTFRIAALVLGALIATGSAAPSRADQFHGQVTSQLIPGTQVVHSGVASSLRTLSGDLAPFGPVSGLIQQNVDLSTLQFLGYFVLTTHGGSIYGYVTGQLVPTDQTFQSFHVIEQFTLTGGTGRWEGLQGTGTGVGTAYANGTATEYDSGTFTLRD
jgi:hypothetical protein